MDNPNPKPQTIEIEGKGIPDDPNGKQSTHNGEGNSELTGKARSLLNLRPFQPGECHNPGGRPRGKEWRGVISDLLKRKDKHGRTEMENLAEQLLKDDPRLLLEYAFGKPRDAEPETGLDALNELVAAGQRYARQQAGLIPKDAGQNPPQAESQKLANGQ